MCRKRVVPGILLIVLLLGVHIELAQAQGGGAYIVRPGDTLTGIAARYGLSLSRLAAINGLRVNAWVYVGQRLVVPGAAPSAPAATAAPGSAYIVRRGDTLTGIAARYGLSLSRLAAVNGLHVNAWVYVGQRLVIPGQAAVTTVTSSNAPASSAVYVVRRGDTLIGIARRYGLSASQLAAKNGLAWNSWVYVGQRLAIPTRPATRPAPVSAGRPVASTDKWIDINLSTQTLTAYTGRNAVFSASVSTGTRWYPTIVGTYKIYVKYNSTLMSGPGYYLPNVPYVMYFYRGYGIHGTYWHSNFGVPMSHGCVNMRTADAQWLFNWAPVGTRVVTHY